MTENYFNKSDGFEFSKKEVEKYSNKHLSKKEILKNPIWLALIKENKKFIKEYIKQIHSIFYEPSFEISISIPNQDFVKENFLDICSLKSKTGDVYTSQFIKIGPCVRLVESPFKK